MALYQGNFTSAGTVRAMQFFRLKNEHAARASLCLKSLGLGFESLTTHQIIE
jgi:hypothetical protein